MSRPQELPKKLKSRNTREKDWEPLKSRIIELHISQGLSLQEVRDILKDEVGFEATIRQFRSRISKWNLDKNVKGFEMKYMAQKQLQRQITEPDKASLRFHVRGIPVDPSKIERWKSRTGFTTSGPLSSNALPGTPSGISYATDGEDESPPESPKEERQAVDILARGVPTNSALKIGWTYTPFDVYHARIQALSQSLRLATSDRELQDELYLPENVLEIMSNRNSDSRMEALQHIAIDLEERHGLCHSDTIKALEKLVRLMLTLRRWKNAEEIVMKLLRASKQYYGERHEETLWATRLLGDAVLGQGQWSRAEYIHQKAYNLMRMTLGPESPRALSCLAALANNLSTQTRHREASSLSFSLSESSYKLYGPDHPLTIVRAAKLAESYFHIGQCDKAEALFMQVLSNHTVGVQAHGPVNRNEEYQMP